ncbi:MAG: FKBP-type peptidyl-prolyl cis-trans isomerase [Candidatus Zixiibacteriota bacterium]
MRALIAILSALILMLIIGCGGAAYVSPEPEKPAVPFEAARPAGNITYSTGDTVTTESGLKYVDVVVGPGLSPEKGQTCIMHYTGWLTDGTKFDSSRDREQPFEFPIGFGRVIRGWEEGIASMKVGGRRMLIIPSNLGYGSQGAPPAIPPNATIIFDVALLGLK